MLNVYVCEDVEIQRNKLKKILENIIVMEELDMEIVIVTESPYELLEYAKKTEEVGIYFLDVDLQTDMDGMELAKEIRKYDPRGFIVFVTTHSELSYMTFQYRLEAMDYIVKDEGDNAIHKRVYNCLLNADERFTSRNNRMQDVFTFKVNERLFAIEYDDIIYFETSPTTHKVILHGKNRVTEFYGRIKGLEEKLDGRFYRCNRSFLLNKKNIKEINIKDKEVIMINGEKCPISTRRMKGLRDI
ncbi:MAG: response regulator transcription factor [Lachnospiraceae bacterium]|nr:response regulator transcription factor [Lachnospiraceae bacterium]